MKVLVTGGCGLLGIQLVRTLASRGHEVIALDVRKRDVDLLDGVWGERVRFEAGDITDAAGLTKLAQDSGITAMVHTAVLMNEPISRSDPVRSFRINVEGTLNVLEIARAMEIRCICMSSQSVYGSRPTMDTIPSGDLQPWLGSLYASEKVMCEVLIHSYQKAYGLDTAIFRPNQMYGPAPTQFRTVLDQMLQKALRGEPIVSPSGGDFLIEWTYAPDMAEGIVRALERPKLENRIFNIEENRFRSVGELGEIIKSLIPNAVVEIGPGQEMQGFSLPPSRGMGDTQPMREELELVPTPLEKGVQTCVEWLQANPDAVLPHQ